MCIWGKYTFIILINPTQWAKIPFKYTLMCYIDFKRVTTPFSSSDTGVGHVTHWPKTTEETAQFSFPSFLHFLLWPVVPHCEGRTHKANGGENKGLLGGNIRAWQHRSQHTSNRLTYMVKPVLISRQDTQSTQVYTQKCTVRTSLRYNCTA